MIIPTPTLRQAKDSLITLTVGGRAVSLVVRFRPIAPMPDLPGVGGGWWVELLTGQAVPIVGATRLVQGDDLWAAQAAGLRAELGAHLLLRCTATPSGSRGLAAQCEVSIAPGG